MLELLKAQNSQTRNAPKLQEKLTLSFDARIPGIRRLCDSFSDVATSRLREIVESLSRQAISSGSTDEPEVADHSLALATEAVRRATSLRLHDEQLIAAMVVSSGQVAQMQTGEGKTLVAIVASLAPALLRRGVHVATTNAYLAERDYELATLILATLGVTVGLVAENMSFDKTRDAYNCDVTYGTGYQFGFDYLRDQMTLRDHLDRPLGSDVAAAIHGAGSNGVDVRQRSFAMAIVDEADSVMIDEAMVPLVLSGQPVATETDDAFRVAHRIAMLLGEEKDFSWEGESNRVSLSSKTRERIHTEMRDCEIRQLVRPWSRYVENALYAIHQLQRDIDYVVQNDTVQLVDRNTGRIFTDRTWRDGLHQAVEAKEGVSIRPNDFSTTRITRQRFYQFYERIGGLTGTAVESSAELEHFYGLHIVDIPTHQPSRRSYLPERVFATNESKYYAIVDSVRDRQTRQQPVLVGTTTIAQSRQLSAILSDESIPHVVLNGVQDEMESDIIRMAGEVGAVTVATNMAGRGTDIKPSDEAIALGGLHVIATERAVSSRIDRQLVGRAARQGNPGSCQYFVSAEDELFAKYAPDLSRRIVDDADEAGECHCSVTEEALRAQSRIEAESFENRKKIVRGDAWFDKIRQTLH